MKAIKTTIINIFAGIKLFLIFLVLAIQVPLFLLTQFNQKLAYLQTKLALKMIAGLVGIHVKIYGKPDTHHPLLIISNHISYLDIFSMGANLKGVFVGKAEIKTWPLVGWLAKQAKVLFMDRRPSQAQNMVKSLKQRFENSKLPMVLYPEGTTTNGTYVKDFKSSLFNFMEPQLAGEKTDLPEIKIQPITIIYRDKNGRKLSEKEISKLAWFDNEKIDQGPKSERNLPLLTHLFSVLKKGGFITEIHYLPTANLTGITDRKTLAKDLQKLVSDKFETIK